MRGAFAALLALVLSACIEQEPLEIYDVSQIAAHRLHSLEPIRGVDPCVDEAFAERGYDGLLDLTIVVTPSGNASVVAATTEQTIAFNKVSTPECLRALGDAVESWRYRPFRRLGIPVTARLHEQALVFAAERWRTPRVPFPNVENLDSLRIKLERQGGYVYCDQQRPYSLELRGDGTFTLTEYNHVRRSDGTRERVSEIRSGAIDRQELARLVDQFRAADFYSLLDEYVIPVTHQYQTTLSIEIEGSSARVVDYVGVGAGMPITVKRLQDAVDQVGHLHPWVCGEPERFWAREQ